MQDINNLLSINSLRNEISRVKTLSVTNNLEFHEGCVNTLHWSDSGQYLLSGSDDRSIVVTDFFDFSSEKVLLRHELKAKSNILASKFLPNSHNNSVVTGFKCGCVIRSDLERSIDSHIFSHRFSVYEILNFAQLPGTFATISHDRTVQFFDERVPNPLPSPCARMCFNSDEETSRNPVGTMVFSCPVTAGDVHPVLDHRSFALGTADGFVKFYDNRYLYRNNVDKSPNPFATVRPLGLLPKNRPWARVDYGKFHITGITFEPISNRRRNESKIKDHFETEAFPRFSGLNQVCTVDSTQILVNHMYSSMNLYDMKSFERLQDSNFEEVDLEKEGMQEDLSDSINEQENSNDLSDLQQPETTNRSLHRILMRDVANRNSSQKISMDFLKRETIMSELNSLPRYRQIASYIGVRSQNTVIKNCCFWGNDYIMSGSECGHVIIWNRHTKEPVSSFRGDRCVVNKIAPHPVWPMLALSGIDNSIKIVESNFEETNLSEEDNSPEEICLTCPREDLCRYMQEKERITKKLCDLNDKNNQIAYEKYGDFPRLFPRFGLSQLGRQFIIRLLRSNIMNNQRTTQPHAN